MTSRAILLATCLALGACTHGAPDDHEPLGEASDEVVVCAAGETVQGIDVSIFQGNVNWNAVATSDVRFAISRVSDGTQFIDSKFAANWQGSASVGLIRGAYQFFRPAQSASAQAAIMIQAVGQLGPGDLPAVLDVETADGQSSATIVSKIQTWLDLVEEGTGKRPIIYAASGFWNTLSGTSAFADYDLWVANYFVNCPLVPNTWSGWTMWQYGDNGSVPGIAGPVDVNLFNGSLADLQAYASTSGSSPDVPIEVYWARQGDGSYKLHALAPGVVESVVYRVDGWEIGSSSRSLGFNFPDFYTFTVEKNERFFEVLGYDVDGAEVGRGIGLMDVTPSTAVYIRQMGDALYEIGLERAPSGVAAIEVRADGWLLTDTVTGQSRSDRNAVRSEFLQLGPRKFAISTFNADGTKRGTLHRDFTLQ